MKYDTRPRYRMAALLVEREQLQEEVKQLNATVRIYAEIVRRLESGILQAPGRPAKSRLQAGLPAPLG